MSFINTTQLHTIFTPMYEKRNRVLTTKLLYLLVSYSYVIRINDCETHCTVPDFGSKRFQFSYVRYIRKYVKRKKRDEYSYTWVHDCAYLYLQFFSIVFVRESPLRVDRKTLFNLLRGERHPKRCLRL